MRFLTAALCLAAPVFAAETDYFPLAVGNRWVLQTSASTPEVRTIEVLNSRTIDGKTWFLVAGYAPADRWLRKAADGTVYALKERTGAEETLAQIAAGAPRYRTSLSGCEQSAQPAAQAAPYRGVNYTGSDAILVEYTPENCRDIGITQETYAAGIGLVSRSITTFAGPRTFDLVYAR